MSEHENWIDWARQSAEAALAAMQTPCVWTDNYDETWSSDCGVASEFGYDMSPKFHDWKFCPHCGKPIRQVYP